VSTRVGLGALLVCIAASLCAAQDAYLGKPVRSIEFEPAQQPLTHEQLLAMLPIQIGGPLDPLILRQAIQRLFSTGEYAEVAVDARPAGEGVQLTFITKLNLFVGRVQVDGVPEPPTSGQLGVATQLLPGTVFTNQGLEAAVENIKDTLLRNGLYQASIQSGTALLAGTQDLDIDFQIHAGKRAKFSAVVVEGTPERPLQKTIHDTGWRVPLGLFGWRQVNANRVQSGVENVRRWYEKHDHLLAKVSLIELPYHSDTNTVTPVLRIESGPAIEVQVVGATLSKGKLRSILPIYQERSVDKDLLVEGTRDLTSYLQSQGYIDAQVEFAGVRDEGATRFLDYTVDKGDRHKLVKLELQGNHFFGNSTLRERMLITAASFSVRRGRFSAEYAARDVATIRDLYRSNGFRDVQVTSQVIDDYQGREGDMAVAIHVTEGPQWKVTSLELQGIGSSDREPILALLRSTQGQAYSDVSVANDRDNVLDYYYNRGYPSTKFEFTAQPDDAAHTVALVYRVDPGSRIFVRKIVIAGLKQTRPSLVEDRISLKPGDPLSQTELTESQRRLYDLGIFSRVDAVIQNVDGDEPSKTVLYSLGEASRYTVNVGVGAELGRIGGSTTSFDAPAGSTSFSPRFSLGVDRINFLGLGHTIGLQTRVSTLEQLAVFNYTIPRFQGNPKLTLQFTALFDISHDIRTFSARREEGSVQLSQKVTKFTTFQYRLVYRDVVTLGTPLITPELIPLLSQPVRVGLVGFSLIQDRRDDPLEAHRGSYTTIDLALAAKALGSQTGYGRVLARNATYYRLTKNLVLARSLSFGVIEPYAGLEDIPLPERFFSGGSSSQRAFPDNQAGPRDLETGFPIGGNALLINTVELRFPLFGSSVGGVLFNDIGNVYTDLSSISARFRQHNRQDFDYGVQAIGFGLRYKTPVGPLRIDLSVSPNSPRFFGFKGTEEELLFGGGTKTNQRINVFQFHFSLGQAF
jgi:outer membrane protein insertion porin family